MRTVSFTAVTVAICCAFASGRAAADPDSYTISNLATLGGTRTQGNSINNRGWVAGFSTYAGNSHRFATAWYGGQIHDLGTLGGPKAMSRGSVKNVTGLIAGISQTATLEPLGETWSCAGFLAGSTGFICRGFAWQDGQMRMLPTLGGNNGFAAGANNRGQITGWAETTTLDPSEGPGPGKSGQCCNSCR
jgi:uncharacterized membrane protein